MASSDSTTCSSPATTLRPRNKDLEDTSTVSTDVPLGQTPNLQEEEQLLGEDPDFDDSVAPKVLIPELQAKNVFLCPNRKLHEFLWTPSPSSHAVRRRAILEKHPEIEQLYGADSTQIFPLIFALCAQYVLAYCVSVTPMAWWKYLLLCILVSSTLNHSLFTALHEASHRTMVESKLGSEALSILATLPMALPAAIPFKRYHLDHHIYFGVEKMDPDLPTSFEGRLVRGFWGKLAWLFLLPATYSLRPMIVRPKPVLPIDIVSWVAVFISDVMVWHYFGLKGLGYFLLGTFFSMNFHPFAGHFISEHYIFPGTDGYQETYSYYGLFNVITYNVGYHNEHHDFPRVPGSRLPLVRKLAPEFYLMPSCASWARVMFRFLLTPGVTPFNRVMRVGINGGNVPAGKPILHEGRYPHGGTDRFWPVLSELKSSKS